MENETLTLEARQADQAEELYLSDLLPVALGQKKRILLGTLAAALVSVIISLLLPVRYTATATIMPPQQNQSLAGAIMGQLGALGGSLLPQEMGLHNPNDIYVALLKSRTVEDALIDQFDLRAVYRAKLMSHARKALASSSTIMLPKEGLITISVEDKSPKRAADIANAYVVQLRHLVQDLAVAGAGQRREFFEAQLRQASQDLAAAEQALEKTQHSTGIIQLEGQARATIESVARLRAEIAVKETQLRAMRTYLTEKNRDVQLAEEELSGMRAQLPILQKQAGDSDHGRGVMHDTPEANLEYVRGLRAVTYNEMVYELLAKQVEAARLDERGAVIQLVDPAVAPDTRSSPKRTLIVIMGTLLGLFGMMAYVVGRYCWQWRTAPHRY